MNAADLAALHDAPPAEAIEAAERALGDADRNVRVAGLRLVTQLGREDRLDDEQAGRASALVLDALRDDKRRVRAVAIKTSAWFLASDEVVVRLRELFEDEQEMRRLRGQALFTLAHARHSSAAVRDMLRELTDRPRSRLAIFRGLASTDLNPTVEELLGEFATSESEAEATAARRALGGAKLANLGNITAASIPGAERAPFFGRVFYWVPRDAEVPTFA